MPALAHQLPAAVPVPMTEFKKLERDNLMAALEQARGRIAGAGGAAELLGLAPSTLRDRIRALGISR
jgi:transcriptional regulator with GAF, ATPase, and Fis domain